MSIEGFFPGAREAQGFTHSDGKRIKRVERGFFRMCTKTGVSISAGSYPCVGGFD
jgi:hypothetical protein